MVKVLVNLRFRVGGSVGWIHYCACIVEGIRVGRVLKFDCNRKLKFVIRGLLYPCEVGSCHLYLAHTLASS